MPAGEQKTVETGASVDAFLAGLQSAARRADAQRLRELMERVSAEPAAMWGGSIVGFGRYAYTYASGRSGVAARIGFSPRKADLVLYLHELDGALEPLLAQLGPHRRGRACVYLKRLDDVDEAALARLVEAAWDAVERSHPA